MDGELISQAEGGWGGILIAQTNNMSENLKVLQLIFKGIEDLVKYRRIVLYNTHIHY